MENSTLVPTSSLALHVLAIVIARSNHIILIIVILSTQSNNKLKLVSKKCLCPCTQDVPQRWLLCKCRGRRSHLPNGRCVVHPASKVGTMKRIVDAIGLCVLYAVREKERIGFKRQVI